MTYNVKVESKGFGFTGTYFEVPLREVVVEDILEQDIPSEGKLALTLTVNAAKTWPTKVVSRHVLNVRDEEGRRIGTVEFNRSK